MTAYADRQTILGMVRDQLASIPDGVGIGTLVRSTVESGEQQHLYVFAIEAQNAIFDLIACGEAEWTKRGPVRLRGLK